MIGVFHGAVADDRLVFDVVRDAVLLDRRVRRFVNACQKQRQKRGVVAKDHARKLTVLGADVFAHAAVVAHIYFVFPDLELRLENLYVT